MAFGVCMAAAVVGCGGGGNATVNAPAPTTPVVQTFNLYTAWTAYWASTTPLTGTVVATQNGQSGTAVYSEDRSALVAATFEGQAAFRKTVVGTVTPTSGSPATVSEDQYFDANSNFLGASGASSGYSVVTFRPTIPTAVKVGDSGTWYSAISYTNSSKAGTPGVSSQSYSVQADAADSVLVVFTEAGAGGTRVSTFRLTLAGVLKKVKVQSTIGNLSSTMTFN